MSRITYKMIKRWIEEWNTNHPEIQFRLASYDEWYHLGIADTGENIIVEKTPGRLWESFCIWKRGYFSGIARGGDDLK